VSKTNTLTCLPKLVIYQGHFASDGAATLH